MDYRDYKEDEEAARKLEKQFAEDLPESFPRSSREDGDSDVKKLVRAYSLSSSHWLVLITCFLLQMKIAEVSADQAQAALAGSSGIEEAVDLLLENVASDGPPSKREMKKKKKNRLPGSAALKDALHTSTTLDAFALPGGEHTRALHHETFDAGIGADSDWQEQKKVAKKERQRLERGQHVWCESPAS